jgi:FAS-associated factor 2
MEFTGASQQRAQKLLENSNWQVPEAVARFFQETETVPAIPRGGGGWSEFFSRLLNPFRACLGWVLHSVWHMIKLFFAVPVGTGSRQRSGSGSLNIAAIPPIPGDFANALSVSRQRDNRKVLIVFLHNSRSPDFDTVVENILCDESVVSVIGAQFPFWAGDTDYMQVEHLRRVLPVKVTPILAAVVSPNASELKIVGICGGTAGFTVQNILTVLQQAQDAQDRLMAEDEQFKINRSLREQQDVEYEQALKKDQEVEQAKSQEHARVVNKQSRRDLNDERRASVFERSFQDIPALEPSADTCTIVVRLPGGVRIERHFMKNEKVAIMYDWVFCSGLIHPHAADVGRLIYHDNFALSTSFPSTRIDDKDKTFADHGLVPNAVLAFSYTDEEDLSDLDR